MSPTSDVSDACGCKAALVAFAAVWAGGVALQGTLGFSVWRMAACAALAVAAAAVVKAARSHPAGGQPSGGEP